ncbi:hypothetical protein [Solwaraspora sp. WMMA2065]|uniref:hypothetical protein n=1 Tax=Solwaraspora sp. WMMA2065 TaxID=3015166 RepID=UPI00259B0D96|nr:hypothetical protein [Solwaraspora sp. WMMA2065]WJK33170.1 hypothetical protein O7610_20975 [Solwaraspora sp. WMMA2065]
MRYEMASRLGHLPTSSNPVIAERLARYRKPEDSFNKSMIVDRIVDVDSLGQTHSPDIKYVVCVDGSGHEDQEAYDRYPSTRVLYMQIAGVFIDLRQMLEQAGPFVDPARLADATESSVVSGFLPGSFLEHETYDDPNEAFRAEFFELFADTVIQKRSLLELLLETQRFARPHEAAAAERGNLLLTKCPNRECALSEPPRGYQGSPIPGLTISRCSSCSTALWPTDALRIWEQFSSDDSNKQVLNRTSQIVEHLVLIGVALGIEAMSPRMLQQTAFICDGDLALFGEPARFQHGLRGCWQEIIRRSRLRGHQPPTIIGVAKSGYPVEHFHGIRRFVERRHLMRLDDAYMTERLRVRSLAETYFGRKLFYHSGDGQLLVITVVPETELAYGYGETDYSDFSRFPALARTLDLLDNIGTRLYDDALIPVALAHHWAAYPLANAEKVLRMLTERTVPSSE